jgi:hypothetical protein
MYLLIRKIITEPMHRPHRKNLDPLGGFYPPFQRGRGEQIIKSNNDIEERIMTFIIKKSRENVPLRRGNNENTDTRI